MGRAAVLGIVLAVLLWLVPVIVGARVAKRRGRSQLGGAILAVFLGWLGVGLVLLLQRAPGAAGSDEADYRFWWVVALHRALSSWRVALATFGLVLVTGWAAGLNLLFALEMAVAATVVSSRGRDADDGGICVQREGAMAQHGRWSN